MLPLFIDCSIHDCYSECETSGTFTDTKGTITTPNYPFVLPPFTKCTWTISPDKNLYIELVFENIDKHNDDYEIEPGICRKSVDITMATSNDNDNHITWSFCNEFQPLFISSSSSVSVDFNTQLETKSEGFKAHYKTTGMYMLLHFLLFYAATFLYATDAKYEF